MAIDYRTPNLNLALPNKDNTLREDVERVRDAFAAIDTAVAAKAETSALSTKADLVSGKVPAIQLPSFVDDVVEVANFASLPTTGESGKIYVTLDTDKTYRWGGSAYAEISASPGSTDAVPEGAANKYYTDVRARAAQVPATVSSFGVIKIGTGLNIDGDGKVNVIGGGGGGSTQTFTEVILTPASNGQTSFTITGGYIAGQVELFLNGVLLYGGGDYTATDGSAVVLTSGVNTTDKLLLRKWSQFDVANLSGVFSVGDIMLAAKKPANGTWLSADGSIYLQSSYAALYAELGIRANTPEGVATLTTRTLPAGSRMRAMAYGNGVFVAISGGDGASSNIAATSPDGATWTQRTLPSTSGWRDIAFGNGLFVAVIGGSSVTSYATSPDGITWTQRTSLPSARNWVSITFGNGVFVALSTNAVAATSTNGITWTQRTLPTSQSWGGITFGGGTFVAVSGAGSPSNVAITSPNGITWTARTLPATTYWQSVAYGDGVFVAVAGGYGGATVAYCATSSDGITWTQRAMPASNSWQSVTYGVGLFLAVANSSTVAATSSDGITWTARTLPSTAYWSAAAYGGGVFAVVAGYGAVDTNAASSGSVISYNTAAQFAVPIAQAPIGTKSWIKAL